MSKSPIILLAGGAGSGKDTVAEIIKSLVPNTAIIAQADPMKHLAGVQFDFTFDQLFGPSESRNAVDGRFNSEEFAWDILDALENGEALGWVEYFLPYFTKDQQQSATTDLIDWARSTLQRGLREGGLSARYVLQTLGTEWGRKVQPNVWTRTALETANKLLEGGYAYERDEGLIEVPKAKVDLVVVTDGRFRNEILTFSGANAHTMRIENPVKTELSAGVKGHQSEEELKAIPDYWFESKLINDKSHGLDGLKKLVETYVDGIIRPTPVRVAH